MSMSQFSCKVILFPLISEDLTCLFFQKDAQETRIKVFGSCEPEIKEKKMPNNFSHRYCWVFTMLASQKQPGKAQTHVSNLCNQIYKSVLQRH